MSDTGQRLVYMVNQIARNFRALGHDAAVKATAGHIRDFWDPRMKRGVFAILQEEPGQFLAEARAALETLRHERDAEPTDVVQ
jgi:formate dehydrogenase subunit delta